MGLDISFLFIITYVLSTLFAMAGIGSAVALVPLLNILGMELNGAKSIGLFINSASTISASYMNFKRGVLDVRFALPMIVSSTMMSPLGAIYSQSLSTKIIMILLIIFLITSATLLLIDKKKQVEYTNSVTLFLVGGAVGFLSGIIGIGGGAYIVMILVLLGYDAKKVAYAVSLVIPFSTLSAFFVYSQIVSIDYILLGLCAISAILGGITGNYIMHYNLSSKNIKILIAVILYAMALKLLINIM